MTPLLSWVLLISIGLAGAAFALAFARWLDDAEWREWEADMAAWRAMCDELDFPQPRPRPRAGGRVTMPDESADEHPHRGA
jgi:hypothetical protein